MTADAARPLPSRPLQGVGAVVVSHRTPHRAAECAASLRRNRVEHLVVVDAGSGDDTAAVVGAAVPDATVLEEANLGFGRCANAGVAALDPAVDTVVVCNADTRWVGTDSVRRLVDGMAAAGAVLAGPWVSYPDGRPQASARSLPSPRVAFGHALLGRWWPDNPWTRAYRDGAAGDEGPDWVSGCAFAVDREAFVAVGGFDPGYVLYVEDVDLAVRLRDAGGEVAFVPAAHVVHEVGASTGRRRVAAVAQHARSLDRFVATHLLHGPARLLRPLLRVVLAGWAASQLVWEATLGRRSGRSTTGE